MVSFTSTPTHVEEAFSSGKKLPSISSIPSSFNPNVNATYLHEFCTFGAQTLSPLSSFEGYPGLTSYGSDNKARSLSAEASTLTSQLVHVEPTFESGPAIRKSRSFVAIAPYPPSHNSMTLTHDDLSQPRPHRQSLLFAPSGTEPSLTKYLRLKPQYPTDLFNSTFPSSLTAQTPPVITTSSPSLPDIPSSQESVQSNDGKRDLESDPLILLHWLTQVDLSKFGYLSKEEIFRAKKIRKSPKLGHNSFKVPSIEEFSRIEAEFMDAVKRKHRTPSSASSPYSSPRTTRTVPSTPKRRTSSFSDPQDDIVKVPKPKSPTTPRVPYKGRFGLNPTCGSCKTMKTPYWRDSWSDFFILCNACGLRYSKFKRYCNECNYVPRKEDKGAPCCPICSSHWSVKT